MRLALIFLAATVLATRGSACECAEAPPPCQAVGQTPLIFVGTVTEVNTEPKRFKTVRMNVDRVFKGDLNKTVELFDNGMCDGPDLQPGQQYLMYSWRLPSGVIPARGCTRSRRIENADEDLKFLEQYSLGAVATRVYGTVRLEPDTPEDSESQYSERTPLKDVRVTLSANGKQVHAMTNSVGMYSFSHIAPGKYSIDADLQGYGVDWAPDSVTLVANGCAEANLLMKVDRRVEGRVLLNDGTPASGALIEMVSTNERLKVREQPVLLDITGQDGRYSIAGIVPGDYYLGVNIRSTPRKQHPYPPSYYPGTPDRTRAMPISVVTGASVQTFDFRVPGKLPLVTLKGRVQTAGGKPPRLEDHPQVRIKEPDLSGQIEEENIAIDAHGHFQFELCAGITYGLFAFAGPISQQMHSVPVLFTPTEENDQLVLTLDKSEGEFLELWRRARSLR